MCKESLICLTTFNVGFRIQKTSSNIRSPAGQVFPFFRGTRRVSVVFKTARQWTRWPRHQIYLKRYLVYKAWRDFFYNRNTGGVVRWRI